MLWGIWSEGHAGLLPDDLESWVKGALLCVETLVQLPGLSFLWSGQHWGPSPWLLQAWRVPGPLYMGVQGVLMPQFCRTGSRLLPQ